MKKMEIKEDYGTCHKFTETIVFFCISSSLCTNAKCKYGLHVSCHLPRRIQGCDSVQDDAVSSNKIIQFSLDKNDICDCK